MVPDYFLELVNLLWRIKIVLLDGFGDDRIFLGRWLPAWRQLFDIEAVVEYDTDTSSAIPTVYLHS